LSLTTTWRAASRLTPKMAGGQILRLARNKAVPKAPARYDELIRRSAQRLPTPHACSRIPADLAQFIGAFYVHDEQELVDAARGRFTLLGRTVDFGSISEIDWHYRLPEENDHHLWRMKLAQLEVVHSLVASGNSAHQKVAIDLIEGLVDARSFASADAFKVEWAPYGASHRLLAMLSGLSIAARQGHVNVETQTRIEDFARLDAGFLWLNIEHDLRNNHTERNLAALCLYHLAAESISPKKARILDREVGSIVRATVLADGMQIERSAMYQGLTVMSLRIFSACPFLSEPTRELARTRGEAAAAAWSFLTHHDGEIALFNDSWMGEVPQACSVLAGVPAVIPQSLPEAGYFRIGNGSAEAIMDIGPIGPSWNPGHGHADFLALEVDVRGSRFIVDPGTSQYSTGPQRTYERSAASHNGPRYIGVEPVEYTGCFKVGRLNHAEPIPAGMLSGLSVEAIGGAVGTASGSCARVVASMPSGGLLVIDRWSAARSIGATDVLIPAVWRLGGESGTEIVARSESDETTLRVFEGCVGKIREATWSRQYLRTEVAHAVSLAPARNTDGTQALIWGVGICDAAEVKPILKELSTCLVR
jgi:uncharacterized heparinase superfamily protein